MLSKSNGLRIPFHVETNVYFAASVLSAIRFFSNKSREFLSVALCSFSERRKSLFFISQLLISHHLSSKMHAENQRQEHDSYCNVFIKHQFPVQSGQCNDISLSHSQMSPLNGKQGQLFYFFTTLPAKCLIKICVSISFRCTPHVLCWYEYHSPLLNNLSAYLNMKNPFSSGRL